ncbi:MAG TPA: oligosaccharide flippase family protein [Thermoleophilaceae bacterium]|nr:oligosaccharide flippase family protein [Thermoleophilaceae bacterium]
MSGRSERLHFPREELRGRTIRGGVLNALFLGGGEALALVQGLVVTALLGPVAIGLYGIVTTTAMTMVQLRRVGIDEAFVQQDEEGQEEEFQRAFSLELAIGVAFSFLLALLAPVVALVYGDMRLLALTLAVSYLPIAFALQAPQWIFFRRMDFLRLRLLQFSIPAVTFLVTVPLAAVTGSVWAMVIGPAAGNLVAVAAALKLSPYRLALRFERQAMRRYLAFSWPILFTALATLIVLQGQIFAFDLKGGLAAAGFITVAVTLTRYADRADQIVTTTIYPAICEVVDDLAIQAELFVKSSRVTMIWALPFCAGLALFAADLVDHVLGAEWEPAVILIQGLAVAAALQQIGFAWISFYRARGESWVQAVESAAMLGGFLLLAVPGLIVWDSKGFVAGRVATSVAMLVVRRHYVRALFPEVRFVMMGLRGALPVLAGTGATLALRAALDPGTVPELLVFLGVTFGAIWGADRPLLTELLRYLRRPNETRSVAPDASSTPPANAASHAG